MTVEHQARLQRMVVMGTSGHAREILSIAEAAGSHDIVGCVGPYCDAEAALLPVPYLGHDGWLTTAAADLEFVIGIGSGRSRAGLDLALKTTGRRAGVLIHPAASVGPRPTLSDGCVVWPGVVVMTDVTMGRHVHVNSNVVVSHDAFLDDYVTLLPGSVVCGSARISKAATIGAGATVIDGVSVGPGAMVGAGAVAINDVPKNAIVAGVPARLLRTLTD